MYAEIVEALILSKIIEIFFMLFALVGTFFLIRAIEKHFEKKAELEFSKISVIEHVVYIAEE